ncbi:unnamed protein product [Candida verbasci]|uniref:Importin N-terminal domain-containing protein n=1 Tax=Candida verbasci TaxID=1227364 RepID=A0A9W4TS46_9ASCO|nr:unnamed protein product [Candida verbasci]
MSNSLQGITKLLQQSLLPQLAKQSELQLKSIEIENGFSINLLHVIASTNLSSSIRLAGALYFKNLIKRRWLNEDGVYLLPIEDINKIKDEILDIMIKLPLNLQLQIGESITLIAESDFPHNWPNLIDNLVLKLSLTDFVNNKSILLVSHSIFKKWRPLFRSDDLFLEIKLVLDKFVEPFLKIFIEIDKLISETNNQAKLEIYLENLLLLIQIYYDFNCQDIPEFFEDHMNELMSIVHKYLVYNNQTLVTDSDDEVSILIKVKTSIIELLLLYVTRYADVFEPLIQTFITSVWDLINNYVTKQQKFDLLVVKSLQFLTSIIKIPNYQSLFQNEQSINEIIEKIILPNIVFRENDEELFEDEPIIFVRSDLEGSDFDSRRKSATDFLRELKEFNSELLTNSVMKYVNQFLSLGGGWKNKDTAIYLFSSLATKGSVTNIGVTSTNVLVDVVKFFSDNVANDLESSNFPILQVDAIKYIYTFRNQLTKEQLLITIPRLINHLNVKSNPVVYTYSAITIEKLLSMTNFSQNHSPVFNKSDIEPFIGDLLTNLFNLILSSSSSSNQTPEKLAENEFLIKCIMRVLNTSEDLLTTNRLPIIEQLIKILKLIAKNPSNPKFSHYIFESLGLLIKYGITQNNINSYIELIIPELLNILSEDVQEFVPYTFQILAYLLENYCQGLPETYKSLIEPLMSPSIWQFKGNIPGVTRLLIAIIEKDPNYFKQDNIVPLLGVFQNLLASKINDNYGFDLITIILLYIPLNVLTPFLNNIAKVILTRLQKSRTEKFIKKFTLFINNLNCIPNSNKSFPNQINSEFIIKFMENVQIGLFQQIFQSFIIPTSKNLNNLQDKKIVNIGLSLIISSESFAKELIIPTITTLIENLKSYEGLKREIKEQPQNPQNQPLNELDLDLTSFGSNYSKIISIQNGTFDPLSMIKNNDFETIKLIILNNLKKIDLVYLGQLSIESQNDLKQLGFV